MASRQPRGRPPRRRRRGRSAGQALVEFALIAPVFFVAFFGVVEFALIMTTLTGYNFAVREGARYGSIIGRADPAVDTDGILPTILNRTKTLPFGTPLQIDIYRSTAGGSCISTATPAPNPPAIVPVGDALCAEDQYTCTSSTTCTLNGSANWAPTDRNDTLVGADYLGVRVLYEYTFVTSFLNYYCTSSCTTGNAGTHLNLSATSVQRIEPQDFGGDVPARPPVAAGANPWLAAFFWPALTWGWEGAAL